MLKCGVAAVFLLLAMSLSGAAGTHTAEKAEPHVGQPASSSSVPDDYKLTLLIRTTIVALNQANATGNYSVLRDLAAPGFQAGNSQARLAEIFGALRGRKLDLSPILFFDPKLVQPPAIQPDGRLRITGFFDTRPERVIFDLMFENVDGDWRLFGIAIDVMPPEEPKASGVPSAADKSGGDGRTSSD